MADAPQLAQQILDAVGGSANTADVENCVTRLRVEVVSDSSVALEDLKATDGVMAAIAAGSNLQIVLGPGLVDDVADGLEALRAAAPSAAAGGLSPEFLGMNVAKEFGGTPILVGAIGGIIIAAGVANATVFGETLAPGQSGVLGALAGGILAA
ncbi:phosphotransferase system IIB component [Curtobacterium herbarum]|uniref:PTS transporter subunit EIIB n=1 Tax=Curtobacterium herbarum TaxID=150122 RepID=UPI0020A0112A|nr:PTS glucose/sucrose transporter subunit IIB [Curtobacterium herbarum]MCP1501539.1 phosphotransferase system IIB component [Curtobacterium herbarum]